LNIMSPRILLGRIGAAHGLRGEVVVQSFAARLLDLKAYGALTDKDGGRTFEIASLRQAGKGLIARLTGIDDRNAAEALRGTELFVLREKLPAPSGHDFYLADLIGLAAVAPDGSSVGEVIDVPNYGAGDLIEIRPEGGGETLLIPFTQGNVPSVDIAGGRLLVAVPAFDDAEAETESHGEEE
jgi:16S rRNA processing protein RimM